jgi:hypothetical protein
MAVAKALHRQEPREMMRVPVEDWGFRLPMASAILAVLDPEEFTLYDRRVCDELGGFRNLADAARFDRLWPGYQKYVAAVREAAPVEVSLRDKDRWLWGRSSYRQLEGDIARRFGIDEE